MKTKLTLFIFSLLSIYLNAQEDTAKQKIISKIKSVSAKYKSDVGKKTYNPKMLNSLISKHIGSYYTQASDVSLQKFSASIDTEDNTIDFGLNWDLRDGKKTKRLKWLGYSGFSIKSDKNFAVIKKNGEFNENNNLVLKAKLAYFFRGSVFYDNKRQEQIEKIDDKKVENFVPDIVSNKREKLIKAKSKEIKEYIDDDLDEDYKVRQETFKYRALNKTTLEEDLVEFGEEKYTKFYTEIAEKEQEFVENNNLYKAISSCWISIDVNFPVFKESFTIVNAITDTISTSGNYRPFKISGSYSYFKKFKKHVSYYFNGQLSFFNNNSLNASNISGNELSSVITLDNGSMLANNNDKSTVYVANGFKDFVTTAIKGEGIFYFYKNMIGISGAVEFNKGKDFDPINWKLGVPISLKDKEGNSTISFELQWKELNYNHFLGIKAGFNFGKFIN